MKHMAIDKGPEAEDLRKRFAEEFHERFRPFIEEIQSLTEDREMLVHALKYYKYLINLGKKREFNGEQDDDTMSDLAARIKEICERFGHALDEYLCTIDESSHIEVVADILGLSCNSVADYKPISRSAIYQYIQRRIEFSEPVNTYKERLIALIQATTEKLHVILENRSLRDLGVPCSARASIVTELDRLFNKSKTRIMGSTNKLIPYSTVSWRCAAEHAPEIRVILEEHHQQVAALISEVMRRTKGNHFFAAELLATTIGHIARLLKFYSMPSPSS